MAWTTPRTWVTGEVVTAALLNAQIKGNSDLAAAAIMTAAGDIIYASGANTPARVAKGTNGNIIHQASCAPAWTASPSITGITLSGTLDANGTVDADVLTLMFYPAATLTWFLVPTPPPLSTSRNRLAQAARLRFMPTLERPSLKAQSPSISCQTLGALGFAQQRT